tara:strand:+ start:166 stop:615 length:450 start_codon:yes stop_codon:yes gene_type:complete
VGEEDGDNPTSTGCGAEKDGGMAAQLLSELEESGEGDGNAPIARAVGGRGRASGSGEREGIERENERVTGEGVMSEVEKVTEDKERGISESSLTDSSCVAVVRRGLTVATVEDEDVVDDDDDDEGEGGEGDEVVDNRVSVLSAREVEDE